MKNKFFWVLLIFIFLMQFSFSEVLVSSTIDKANVTKNEVARLNIKILNDSLNDLENYNIRLEASENLVFINNEQKIYGETISLIKSGETKELTFNFKPISTAKDIGKVFVYYGDNLEFVSGTFVNVVSSPILVKTNLKKNLDQDGEKIIVDFELFNYSKERIYEVSVEVLAPTGFVVQTPREMISYLDDNNSLKKSFEILSPMGAVGEQKIIISYIYFDQNQIHYFEETNIVTFEDNNRFFLAGVGIIILVIAIFLYLHKTSSKSEEKIKGTGK